MNALAEQARFVERRNCIACGSSHLRVVASGTYSDEPLKTYLERDPWGVSPIPHLTGCPWALVSCRTCQQLFQKWLLSPEWQEIKFRDWMSESAIREFEERHGVNSPGKRFIKAVQLAKHVLRIEKLTRSIRQGEAPRVLDFGCGFGEFLTLANQFGFETYGIDRAPDRQLNAKANGVRVSADLDEFKNTIGGNLHAASLFQVLEHVDEPLQLLRSIHSILAMDGILIIEVPDSQGVEDIKSESDYYVVHPLEHINCFTPQTLVQIARMAGFEPLTPPVVHISADLRDAAKGEIKRVVQRLLPKTTNQYFRRQVRQHH
jgi:SAM-dependent methyltransferase